MVGQAIGKAITASRRETVFEKILDAAIELTRNHDGQGSLFLMDELGDSLEKIALYGQEWTAGVRPKTELSGKGIVSYVARLRELVRIADVTADGWWSAWYSTHEPDIRSEIALPMLESNGELVGVIHLASPRANAFTTEDERILLALAEQGVIAHQILTGERERERELQEMRENIRAAEIMTELGLEAGELAHRFSNWFGLAHSQIVKIKKEIGAGYAMSNELLDELDANVARLLTLTRKLRDEVAVDTPRALPLQVFDAAQLVQTTIGFRKTDPNVIQVKTDLAPNLPSVRAVENILDAFINVYVNALDELESKGGGTITFTVEPYHEWIEFQVADDGRGMDSAKLAKIFRLFYSDKKNGNLGFGLWSVKRRVVASGGTIWGESRVGKGTTFFIRLPAAT